MLISPQEFARKMLAFYDEQGRKDLPWQQDPTAYRVWVSEIMLQQTQVKTVIPYYEKFMARFPDVKSLASAETDEVMHYWQGLGYYSRARNLHACAKRVVEDFAGEFPDTLEEMESLPGIGRSTAGAILSLAKDQPTPILDGNVKRVLARVFLVDGWYGKSSVARQLWQLTETYTPKKRTGNFNQAMMDLGASLCSRSKPRCNDCPLRQKCLAFQQDKTAEYPHKKPRKTIPQKYAIMYLDVNPSGDIALIKRPPSGIWGGLWSLPESAEGMSEKVPELNEVSNLIDEFEHTFTHFRLKVSVLSREVSNQIAETPGQAWHNIDHLPQLAFPTPVKKFLFRYFQLDE